MHQHLWDMQRFPDSWCAGITALAERPNVVCKVSGLVAYADPATWTEADLRPWFDHVALNFGWHRLLWGGVWPVCTLAAPLSRWVAAAHTLTAHASLQQRDHFFQLNAERIYRV
jgi:predicted TIM-barrel fold metal-dependent hydrolase